MTPAEIAAARACRTCNGAGILTMNNVTSHCTDPDCENGYEVHFSRLTDLGQAMRQRDYYKSRLARACELLKRYSDACACVLHTSDNCAECVDSRAFLSGEVT